jgi:hypothetical protein
MFKKLSNMRTEHQTIFALIIAFAVISFWRGIWGLMDVYLFPNNLPMSFIASLVIGLVILILTHYTVKELM